MQTLPAEPICIPSRRLRGAHMIKRLIVLTAIAFANPVW